MKVSCRARPYTRLMYDMRSGYCWDQQCRNQNFKLNVVLNRTPITYLWNSSTTNTSWRHCPFHKQGVTVRRRKHEHNQHEQTESLADCRSQCLRFRLRESCAEEHWVRRMAKEWNFVCDCVNHVTMHTAMHFTGFDTGCHCKYGVVCVIYCQEKVN